MPSKSQLQGADAGKHSGTISDYGSGSGDNFVPADAFPRPAKVAQTAVINAPRLSGYARYRQQRPLPSRYCGAVPVCGNAGGGLVVHYPSGAGVEGVSIGDVPQRLWSTASPAFIGSLSPTF